jgi:hypothetical protein
MRRARRAVLMSLVLAAVLCGSCSGRSEPETDPRDLIELRWLPAHARESRADVETGVLWCLSLAGARVPAHEPVLQWRGDHMVVDLRRAQVHDGTRPAWRALIAAMKASGEYRRHGALDVGRFVALTLGSSHHYYALTGATARYESARVRHRFESRTAAVTLSAVAHGHRLIEITRPGQVLEIAFVAHEGTGSLADGTFRAEERELLDVMPNGQLRFALYDAAGRLKPAASPALTTAGKPAKCMWCHESGLQPTFTVYPPVPGHYNRAELDEQVAGRRRQLQQYRDRLQTRIDYRDRDAHQHVELVYLGFEEPSAERVAREWGMDVAAVKARLHDKPTHAQREFPFMGQSLYRRADVDALAPYEVIAAPDSAREPSSNEPRLVGVDG